MYFKTIPVMVKLDFQQSLVSHDPSEILLICSFGAQEKNYIVKNVDKIVLEPYTQII